MPLHRILLTVCAFAFLHLGCEREAAGERPDVVGRWNQEGTAGRDWIELHPDGTAVAYSRTETPGMAENVMLQWYWVDDALMLRGAGGLSQELTVGGDRMMMPDGTVLVRTE